ncbi:hypothetical protein MKW94_007859 [Papaver nudicaule]|uniref:VQ domain-containing protein n=1 Tax=Papaver nudicaule TaxID=74823 RepID=A0AA41UZ94_PAPNU|nr:hypothetical protein [Papaver nudicaule]
METRPSLRKSTNSTINKYSIRKKISKPIKVVYISNPMKVKTTVSEFRSLVQELTGRDSDTSSDSLSIDWSRFSDSNEIDNFQTVPKQDHRSKNMNGSLARSNTNDNIHHQQQKHGDFIDGVLGFDYPYWMSTSPDSSSSILDDVFDVPQVMENMNGFFPLNTFMEAQHLVDFNPRPLMQ